MSEVISILLTEPVSNIIRTAYMRAYENLEDGEKNEILILHRENKFIDLFCGKCKKQLGVNSQSFLVENDRDMFVAYCEECGLGKFNQFFMDEKSLKAKEEEDYKRNR